MHFSGKDFSKEDIDFARGDVGIAGFRITEEKVEAEGFGNMIMLFLFSFLLYMSLIFMGQMTMNSVVEEKSSRIVEVLLSSANSIELMTGKILGTAIIGLIQMTIWLIPVMVVASTSWFLLPPDIIFSIDIQFVLYFLFNFFIALITYVGLFATVGSIFDNPQDAQSGIWPLILLIMIPFFIALSMQANPQSPIAKVASMLPIAALIVMPSRMVVMEVPVWQFLISIVVNISVMLSVFPLAGKIYRVGILITGKKPKWSEVVKWLKYKY
jgi:ABC-2 type transport system permease protein